MRDGDSGHRVDVPVGTPEVETTVDVVDLHLSVALVAVALPGDPTDSIGVPAELTED